MPLGHLRVNGTHGEWRGPALIEAIHPRPAPVPPAELQGRCALIWSLSVAATDDQSTHQPRAPRPPDPHLPLVGQRTPNHGSLRPRILSGLRPTFLLATAIAETKVAMRRIS